MGVKGRSLHEESMNEWLAVCLIWWQLQWKNEEMELVKAFFFFFPVRKVESVLCWQELADGCLLSAPICRVQEQRRDCPRTASERFRQQFTDWRRSLNYHLYRYFIFSHYIFAQIFHMLCCMKVQTYSLWRFSLNN